MTEPRSIGSMKSSAELLQTPPPNDDVHASSTIAVIRISVISTNGSPSGDAWKIYSTHSVDLSACS
jgi:hypothetical protein